MKLFLHELAHSPYCIPIRRLLDAHKIPFESNEIPAWDRRELAQITQGAYYQVPVIECDGQVVHETPEDPLAVPRFLDSKFLEGQLFPAHCDGIQDLVIGHIENILEARGFKLSDPHVIKKIENLGERVMVIRHKERSFGPGCVEAWVKNSPALIREFEHALVPYEKRLVQSTWLFGDKPVYADYALFGIIGNAQYGGHYSLNSRLTHLNRWLTALSNYSANE